MTYKHKPRLIGLAGYKGSGKDTVYEIIDSLKENVHRVGFADKLKVVGAKALGYKGTDKELIATMNACKETWGFDIYDESVSFPLPGHTFTGREYLQWFGQAGRECFGEDFWVNQILPWERWGENFAGEKREWLPAWYPEARVVVITDCRYENEADRVKFLGGEVWQIDRPGLDSDGHLSEKKLASAYIDQVITNDGSLDELREHVRAVL